MYALDPEMSSKLRKANPQVKIAYSLGIRQLPRPLGRRDSTTFPFYPAPQQAFSNILKRMLEASGRGMWNAKPEVVDKLKELFSEMDDQLEGVTRN